MNFITALVKAAEPSSQKQPPIAVMSQTEFQAMSSSEIQDIFSEKHIVVTGVAHDSKMRFDRRGLERVGNWDEHRTLQGTLFIFTLFACTDLFRLVH